MTEKQDEILEAIWTSSENNRFTMDEIRKKCDVAFTREDIEELEEEGLVITKADNILFSPRGEERAKNIMRRHRLAEVLTSSILKLKNSEMEKVACQVEHYLQPEVEISICTLLGHPQFCPDGKAIPPGRCCQEQLTQVDRAVVSLTDLDPGQSGKITYVKPGSHSNLHQLISFGLNPGVMVTLHRKRPALCIKFENTELAIDEEIAANIFVWKMTEKN
ncbi:MAG: metal-dependent transcriptional regulator [Desulfobacterales bacterium]|nr:metal-dependent transcriptional regulator [Desulfobacterales bacterium]